MSGGEKALFPLKNLAKNEGIPFFTYMLIALNVIIFFYIRARIPSNLYLLDFGLIPNKLGMPFDVISIREMIYPFFTYQFLHSGYLHLFFNIYFIYIFGGAVENRIGHFRFILLYIFFGIVAGVVQVMSDISSGFPIIGASGAVAGIIGAYLILYPKEKIKTLFIVVIFVFIRDIPAILFILAWLAIQLGVLFLDKGGLNIAVYAHIGGFAIGVIVAIFIRVLDFFSDTERDIKESLQSE